MADVRIGVVGTGFIARNFMMSLDRHDGFSVPRVLTRRDPRTVEGHPEDVLTQSIDELLSDTDVVLECSGDPIWATEVVTLAVASRKPVVTMNTEFHITSGSAFVGKGLVTEAEGDQPGCLAALHHEAVAMGFEPVGYGNLKGFLNPDPAPEEMEYWGAKQGISLPMVTSFTDGTKVQAEQVLVGNFFGADIPDGGMTGAQVSTVEDGAAALASSAILLGRPITDFVVGSGLPHGVFIVATHDERQASALEYYKLGPGPHYTMLRNNIFVHLEILKTIRSVLTSGQILLDNSPSPRLSLAAVAKHDLQPGHQFHDVIGSFDLRGHAVRISEHPEHVPIGLLSGATVTDTIERDELVDWHRVDVPPSLAVDAWTTFMGTRQET